MFEEGAAASVFPTEGLGSANLAEQGRLKGLANAHRGYVAVAEGRERTGLCRTVGTNVEESTT